MTLIVQSAEPISCLLLKERCIDRWRGIKELAVRCLHGSGL